MFLKIPEPPKFTIVVNKLLMSIAVQLQGLLTMLGHSSCIQFDIPYTKRTIYFIIYYKGVIPSNSIFFQIEQKDCPDFNYSCVKKASRVMDFSNCNFEKYKELNLKAYYLPMPFYFTTNELFLTTKYDLLFYGSMNDRRMNILKKLHAYNIKVGFGIVGEEKEKCIQQSKIIINLHYYNSGALETCRINEVLQYNKLVLSERSTQPNDPNMQLYKEYVDFFDEKNMLSKINFYLNPIHYMNKIKYIQANKYKLMNTCKQILEKNLF
jgi:hypothetical protein